jgi:hypothetical protein
MSRKTHHRREFREFVTNDSEEKYKENLTMLYEHFDMCNNDHFNSELTTPPYITFSAPDYMGHLGSYSPVSDFGGGAHIKIRPALLGKRHPRTKNMPEDGKIRFVRDVLLHQMVHEYLDEVIGLDWEFVQSHGDAYLRKCNEIGERMGLGPVGPPNPPKSSEKRYSALYWPHVVRPSGYYGADYEPRKQMEDLVDYLERTIRAMSGDYRETLFDRLRGLINLFFHNQRETAAESDYRKL